MKRLRIVSFCLSSYFLVKYDLFTYCDKNIVIVKYGGSAVTIKSQFETVNQTNLTKIANQINEIYQRKENSPRFILVHGAGSFGHFQAHQYELKNGGREDDWRIGVSKTRESVLKLNHIILNEHLKYNLPIVSISMFPTTLLQNYTHPNTNTMNKVLLPGSLEQISYLMNQGLIPLTHGDVILDTLNNCTIYSGDRIIQWLVKDFTSKYDNRNIIVVFLTDVEGVYDKPPNSSTINPPPKLLTQIYVTKEGKILTELNFDSTEPLLSHDVTGGMSAKIKTAVDIVKETGIEVFIVQAGTTHAYHVLSGDIINCTELNQVNKNHVNWIGTRISLLKEKELK